ncbi:hypothetical protein DFJ73DRAFT_810663 [Zopfochytrium polystomum]|nr:hypothetical protein DFJ73DRAFT_810663 [Zopfochytrium polystomum]
MHDPSSAPTAPTTTATKTTTTIREGVPTEDEYVQWRRDALAAANIAPYPVFPLVAAAPALTSVRAFVDRFADRFDSDQWDRDQIVAVAGRIAARRAAGKKLLFLELRRDFCAVQVVVKANWYNADADADPAVSLLSVGDVVHVVGFPGRSKSGELSIGATDIKLLSPCLHRLPKPNTLTDAETRCRKRYLDLLVNQESPSYIQTRSKVVRTVREFFQRHDFLEVETPVLSTKSGGANARPFSTTMNALGLNMQLRIAPELYLKKLIVGGFDRVFEIGKQFRNEGVDSTHNPEFTTCEFYQAFGSLDDAASLTEALIQDVVTKTRGELRFAVDSEGTVVDFSAPFRRIHIVPELQRLLNCELPDLNGPDAAASLLQICSARGIHCPEPHTVPRILDKLISELIEPQCVDPTFLLGHPSAMSPLAKDGPVKGVSERFELFVAGQELVNAYAEQNDPVEQLARFEQQAKDRESGDLEAQPMDREFCEALEYGLPPTVGWGLGVDRLCMLVAGTSRIRDVIAFPVMKP